MENKEKHYIGDGVYADFSGGYDVWLTTLEGMRICLEAPVMMELEKLVDRYWKHPEKYD